LRTQAQQLRMVSRSPVTQPERQNHAKLSNPTHSTMVLLRSSSNLRAGLCAPLPSDPMSPAHTHKPPCFSSARVLECATPVQHNLRARTTCCLPPLLLPAHVRMHPSRLPVESGWPPFRLSEAQILPILGVGSPSPSLIVMS